MSDNVVDLVPTVDPEAVLQLRYAGLSIRRLSRHFRCSEKVILDALDAALPQLSQATRIRLYREDLGRIDDLFLTYYPLAKQGQGSAAHVCLKLLERKSAMVGHDSPQRLDVHVVAETADAPGSTAALIRELERIALERSGPADGAVIEHDAEVVPPA
jgi:hypothetical protein